MTFYWSLFALFALGTVLSGRSIRDQARLQPFFITCMVVLALMIGLRYQIGADWISYIEIFRYSGQAALPDALDIGEDGYILVNRLAWKLGADIWLANLICGSILAIGLYQFAKWQPDRWLSLVVAVPYLVIVVGMGYTRQGAGIGFMLLGLAALFRTGSILRLAIWLFLGSLFHASVLIMLPVVLLGARGNIVAGAIVAAVGGYLVFEYLFVELVELYLFRYITLEQQSSGAMVRVLMNVVPALLLLFFGRRLQLAPIELAVWRMFAILSVLMAGLLFFVPLVSTGIDRIALYFIPMQLAILSRAPRLFANERLGTMLVIGYSALVQYVWFTYGVFASYWLPYQWWPFD